MELPYDLAIVLLGICPEKTKTLIQKDTHTPVFIAALFTTAKIWKQPKCPWADEWIKKCGTHIQWNTKQNEIMSFLATWMDLEIIILSKTKKDKYHDTTSVWNLKNDTNEFIYKTETDSQT